ncbi:1-acyl-sn-glycerol-3-phosphate acyltransferase [bacterium]|nr:1-acyl-sn-glycerol-3-phosphate acyltransferase [bacterium]
MKVFSSIAACLVSVYVWIAGLILVGIILSVALLISLVAPPEATDRFLKKACRFLLAALFIRVDAEGMGHVVPGRTAVFMANHVSAFDVPLLEGYIPVSFRGVEAAEHFSWPLYGWVIRRLGTVPIHRENVRASARSMDRAGSLLTDSRSLVILPEGGRTKDGRMLPFKRMPFVLAKQAGADIVPIGLSGLFRLKAKHSWIIRPTRVKIRFGPPLRVEKTANWTAEELRDAVRVEIEKLVERP